MTRKTSMITLIIIVAGTISCANAWYMPGMGAGHHARRNMMPGSFGGNLYDGRYARRDHDFAAMRARAAEQRRRNLRLEDQRRRLYQERLYEQQLQRQRAAEQQQERYRAYQEYQQRQLAEQRAREQQQQQALLRQRQEQQEQAQQQQALRRQPQQARASPFPAAWGAPPRRQTRDLRRLPGGYGYGSSTLARWIQYHLLLDEQVAAEAAAQKQPQPQPAATAGADDAPEVMTEAALSDAELDALVHETRKEDPMRVPGVREEWAARIGVGRKEDTGRAGDEAIDDDDDDEDDDVLEAVDADADDEIPDDLLLAAAELGLDLMAEDPDDDEAPAKEASHGYWDTRGVFRAY